MASWEFGPYSSTGSLGSFYQGVVAMTETPNAAQNKSTIDWAFRIWVNGQSDYHFANGNTVRVTINNNIVYAGNPAVDLRGTSQASPLTLALGQLSIDHDASGQGSVTVVAEYIAPAGGSNLNTITVTGTRALEPFATGDVITSASDTNIGSNMTIKWTPTVSSYRYKLTFTCGSWTATTSTISPNRTTEYTYTYSVPSAAAAGIPNGSTGICTIKLSTYSDSSATQLVRESTATATLTVPDSGGFNSDASASLSIINGYTRNNVTYGIAGQSTYRFTLTCSAGSGASITSWILDIRRGSWSGEVVYQTSGNTSLTNQVLDVTAIGVGTWYWTFSCTDSRGSGAAAFDSFEVTNYHKPVIEASVQRGTGTGSNFSPDESSGEVARVTYKITASTGSGTLTASVGIQNSTARSISAQGVEYFTGCDKTLAYTFIITAYDSICGSSNPTIVTLYMPEAVFPVDFLPDATGMGIHKVATASGSMQVGWNIDIYNDNHLRTMNQAGQVTGDFAPGSVSYPTSGLVRRTINFGGGAVNLAQQFGFAIKEVVSVTPRGYAYPCWWYCSDGTTSTYTIHIYRVDGNSIANGTEFAVVAIPE